MIFIIIINIILLEINIVSSWWSQSQIRSLMNGKCLNIAGGVNLQGTNIEMYDCDDNNIFSQSWYYDILTKEIKNMNPVGIEYCLDLPFGITDDGTGIRIWECNGSNAQKWLLNNDNTISNINGGCLDIKNGNNNNGATVNLWTCDSNNINQKWILVSEIKSIMHGKCLDVDGGKTEPGTNVQMYECNGKNAQKWYYNKLTKEIKNINPNGDDLCLDLENGNTAEGTNIRIFTCNKANAQKWILYEDETIRNINGRCVDIIDFNKKDYANVKLWTCLGGNINQRWFGSFIPMRSPKELIIRETSSYEWIWNDIKSGATLWGSYWKPKMHSTEAFISFVNTLGIYTDPPKESSMVIIRYPSDALANPIDYSLIWDDSGSGGEYSVWVWRPIPPPGYICYGDYVRAHISDKPTSADGYKCIHSRYVHLDSERIATSQELMWNDDQSGADDDIQIIKLRTNHHWPKQYYRSHDKYNRYIDNAYGAIELTVIPPTLAVQMKSALNSLCVQGSGADGHLKTDNCYTSRKRQWWQYVPETQEMKDGYGICLAINGDNVDGTRIQIQKCNGNDNQKWLIDAEGAIINIHGRCMDVKNSNFDAYTNIILWGCHHGVNQLWIGGDSFGIQNIKSFAAKRFAPILRFDQAASDYGYPMNPQTYVDNNCINSFDLAKCEQRHLNIVSNPTYYRILSGYDVHTGTFNIVYWWFYGYQHRCNPTDVGDSGAHKADWERVIVHIKHWLIESVTFYQHKGRYTLKDDDYNNDGDHVYVYVGKIGHGSYYNSFSGISGSCGYFYDFRNPDHSSIINTWNNLINLETSTDAWIVTTGNNKPDFDTGSDPRDDKDNEYGCDSCGCNWGHCNENIELVFTKTRKCIQEPGCLD